MSQSHYEYDTNNETWPVFLLTAIAVPLLPYTYSCLRDGLFLSRRQPLKDAKSTSESSFNPYNSTHLLKFRSSQRKSRFWKWSTLFLLASWIVVLSLIYKIRSTHYTVSESNFDPWKILGISESDSEKVIKTAYRKLSLKFHPDKIDTSNMSPEEIDLVDSSYVLINKAYKALTDESVRENFLKYGNPDGPNEIKHGIALPEFLINGKASPLLVLVYILLISIILPLIVGNWWYGVKSKTKNDIHVNTAHHFMKIMMNASPTKLLLVDDILHFISHAVEFKQLDDSFTPNDVYNYLKSFIDRTPSKNEKLRLKVVSLAPKLLVAFIEISAAFKNTDYTLKLVDAHRCIIQALNIEKNAVHYKFKEILQLPGVENLNINKNDPLNSNVLTLGKLLKKPNCDLNTYLQKSKDTDLDQILDYASKIPLIEPLETSFKVPGEKVISPNSSTNLSLKFLIKSPRHSSKPSVDKLSKFVIDNELHELETLENLKDPLEFVNKQPLISLPSMPPFFPDLEYIESNSGWLALLVSQRDNKIVEIPKLLNKADLSNLYLSNDDFLSSKAHVSTFKIQLQSPAPKEPGVYHFRLIIRNLIYFGSDIDIPVSMEVKENPTVDSDVYGIEDPNEDSIAGAMATLRGEPVKRFENEYESSDDEDDDDHSDTDSVDLWTDLDTDTEVEEDTLK